MPLWIYPENDKEFMIKLLENYKTIPNWEQTEIYQTKFETGKYPQYLCTLDPRGVGGDKCHLWRDGQTWWPMVGDFSFEEEKLIEAILRKSIKKFLKEAQ